MGQVITLVETKKKYEPKNPRIEDRRYYYLTDEEIKKLKLATTQYPAELQNTYHAMICLMLYSGLRRDNVLNLKFEQIDWDNQVLRIHKADIKTRLSTIVPFNDETGRYLRAVIGGRKDGYVFLHKTQGKDSQRRYTPAQINNIVGSIGKKAGVLPKEKFKNVNPHLLRNTWVKKCKEAGVSREACKAWGGWKSFKMIDEVYGQPTIDQLKTEFSKVNW